ncbi:MAG TPA: hypothetical protein VJJ22_01210 [Candidatus Paceibacterota bacterium]
MNNKTIIGIIVAFVAVGGLAYWSLSGKDVSNQGAVVIDATKTDEVTTLIVNHYFDNGSHTIEGTMTLPTPCDTLSQEVDITKGVSGVVDKVVVNFTTKSTEGFCTQVLADKFFHVSFNAGKDAIITATLNGKPLRLIFSETFEGVTK